MIIITIIAFLFMYAACVYVIRHFLKRIHKINNQSIELENLRCSDRKETAADNPMEKVNEEVADHRINGITGLLPYYR